MQTDLISRSAALAVGNVRKVTEFDEAGYGMSYNAVSVEAIEALPAIDAVPVVHARWIDPCINKYGHPCHHCSACGFKASQKDRNYCPNCGARMDKKEND